MSSDADKTKLIGAIIAIIIIIAAAAYVAVYILPQPDNKEEVVLTLTYGDMVKEYTQANIEALTNTTGNARMLKMGSLPQVVIDPSGGGYYDFQGVNMVTLLTDAFGTLPADYYITAYTADSYSMQYSEYDVTGEGISVYDENGDYLTQHDPVTMLLAYKLGGEPIKGTVDGPTRITFVGSGDTPIITGSSDWLKMVNKITLVNFADPVIEVLYDGTSYNFTGGDLFEMDATYGFARNIAFETNISNFTVTPAMTADPYTFRGVEIQTLIAETGLVGLPDYTLKVTSTDGSIVNYTYDQIHGTVTIYNGTTGEAETIVGEDMPMIVALVRDGTVLLDNTTVGPTMMSFVDDEMENAVITNANLWATKLKTIEIIPLLT